MVDYELRKDIDNIKATLTELVLLSDGKLSSDDLKEILKDYATNDDVIDTIENAEDNRAIILALGLGLFRIEDKHLIVELPLQVSNFFRIDNEHLKVTVDGDNPFTINDNGHLIYEELE